MSRTKTRTRIGIACAVAATAAALYACSGSGEVKTDFEIDPPFVDPIQVHIEASTGEGGTFTADGGPDHANKCVTVSWSDAAGADLGSETVQMNGSGHASGQVPAGAVRWEIEVVDCPPPPSEKTPERSASPAGGGGDVTGGGPVSAPEALRASATRSWIVSGGPIVPSAAPGATNLAYTFVVEAKTSAEVHARIDPILSGGPGTPVDPAVTVVSYATVTATAVGGHLTFALPGQLEAFALDVNDGAYATALGSPDLLVHDMNGWQVAEAVVPPSAFELGFMPGATYANRGTVAYESSQLPPSTASCGIASTY